MGFFRQSFDVSVLSSQVFILSFVFLALFCGKTYRGSGYHNAMNKAFIKEPEQDRDTHCPRCGSVGLQVADATLAAQVKAEKAEELGEVAFFCPFARCEVTYFDLFERYLTADDLQRAVYPKDPAAPLCGCFGLTTEDVEADLREGTPRRIRELLAKSQSPAANCAVKSASGRCCMPDVQRYYLKRRQERE